MSYRPSNFPLLPALVVLGTLTSHLVSAEPVAEPPLTDADRAHWAFQKLKPLDAIPLPRVRDTVWPESPVDVFILARLEQAGQQPSLAAGRAVLLRRLTFDLTGLPPTPRELDAFLSDARPDAFDRVVERLLASPHYGERWAQHWLDVVRYAESNGYESDGDRPHAWRYRDYVVRAFNDDKPYDRFLTEQLAGDELAAGKDPRQHAEWLIAAGMHRCGPVHLVGGNTDPEVNRQEVLTEMTGGVGAAFLGLTVGCARCHDHKFDPFSQADYYRLQAFFAATQPRELDISSEPERTAHQQRVRELLARIAPLRKQITAIDAPYHARLSAAKKAALEPMYRDALAVEPKKRTAEEKKRAAAAEILLKISWDEVVDALSPADRAARTALRERMHALEAEMPPPPDRAWTVTDEPSVPATFVLKRGDLKRKAGEVTPSFPRVLGPAPEDSDKRLRRLDLAHWLTRPEHPLTARVLVNRVWQHHFGRGLVATPNDFGLRGAPPTQPELLDWLAADFVAHGWSIKHLHRRIVLSRTYQQASAMAGRRRLDGEALRDAMLATAGTLHRRLGGPMVRVPLEPEVYDLIFTEGEPDGLWPVTPDHREHHRRSLYLFAKRNVRLPLLEAFDRPDTLTSCPVRSVSTFAPQALILMNGPFGQAQSKAFAARLLREWGPDRDRQIDHAYRLALSRQPRTAELQLAQEFLDGQAELLRDRLRARQRVGVPMNLPTHADPAAAAALADFCLALLNCNEFLYID